MRRPDDWTDYDHDSEDDTLGRFRAFNLACAMSVGVVLGLAAFLAWRFGLFG